MRNTHPPTRASQPNLAEQPPLFASDATTAASDLSARSTALLRAEDAYLCAWLRARLDSATLTLREDSALTVTTSDQRRIWRLLQAARARRLDVFAAVSWQKAAA